MKILNTLILLLLSVIALGQSTDELTAEQILDSSIVFCGGEKRIAEIESSSVNYLLVQPDKSTAVVTEKRKSGQKYVQSILSMTHVPQTTFFDGKKLSKVNGSSVIQVDNIKSIEEIKLRTYNQVQYGYKMLNYKLTRLSDKKFQHFDCFVIDAEADNGYITTNFFDKTDFRLLMVIYPNGNKSLMIDYFFKDSVLFNSHIVNTFANSDDKQILKLQHVHLNTNISELWFNCPYQDSAYTPPHIKTGKFESTNGEKTLFTRTEKSQDYYDDHGKIILRRFLKWANNNTYGLINENAIKENDTSPESEILVRIISWDDDEYVCHWISGKYTDTQDYKIKK
ncbi:hypothetical protein SYJ56_04155 [Algoriphagus sp. D3-2-R+10]|uniref:hypothetical protein n=1 Tax=Algoriphagus aurantiacus TaxID=3103948 RepID=UPI002B377336|nr:hypothetical protein [Algoriphagus sp. D3-2-R+10]MEB2774484.1 hypothetical protein [Algoriphagus sp. D3-2-R+10]